MAWIEADYDHKFYDELGEWSVIEEPTSPLKVMIATDSDTDNVNVNANYTDVPENGVAVVVAKNKKIDLNSTPSRTNNFSFMDQVVSLCDKRWYAEYGSRYYPKGTSGIITFRDSRYNEILAWDQWDGSSTSTTTT